MCSTSFFRPYWPLSHWR